MPPLSVNQAVLPASYIASVIAELMREDPLAASLIKNEIPPKELITLLGLDPYVNEQLAQVAQNTDTQTQLEGL